MSGGPDIPARVAAVKQRVSLSTLIGRAVKLSKRGREFSGLCPFHQENTASFTVNDEKDFYHCFGCGAHGDVIHFVMEHEGLDFVGALQRLEGDAGLAAESATQRESARDDKPSTYVESHVAAATVWREAGPARGTVGENWLRARGIDPAESGALDVIRFHPRCPAQLWRTWEEPGAVRRIAPALIAPILRVLGGTGERALSMVGVHITCLSADGRDKAAFQPWQDRRTGKWHRPATRLMWGTTRRGGVPIPAAPLAEGCDVAGELLRLIDGAGLLVVGEGLESTQSLLARTDGARMAWATLSLLNMEGPAARFGKQSFEPLWNLQGDVDGSAPFTFSRPGRVVIGVDADMKPTEPKWVQDRRGALPVRRALTSADRAERCAGLAAWWWRRAGAERVTTVRPPMGEDFNDSDQRRVA